MDTIIVVRRQRTLKQGWLIRELKNSSYVCLGSCQSLDSINSVGIVQSSLALLSIVDIKDINN